MDAALSKLAKKDVPYAKMIPVQKDSDKSEFVEAQDERWVTSRKWPRWFRAGSTPTGVRLRLASPRCWRAHPFGGGLRRRGFPLFVRRHKRRTFPCCSELLAKRHFCGERIQSCSAHSVPRCGALGCIDLVPAAQIVELGNRGCDGTSKFAAFLSYVRR